MSPYCNCGPMNCPQWYVLEGRLGPEHIARLYYPSATPQWESGWRWEIIGPVAAYEDSGITLPPPAVIDAGSGRTYEDAVAGIMESWAKMPHSPEPQPWPPR